MQSILNDIPSIPQVPSVASLRLGITTRILAKRLAQNKKTILELKKHPKEKDIEKHRRRSSKFMEGAAIPNSVVKGNADRPDTPELKQSDSKHNQEEFAEKLIEHLQSQKKMHHSTYDENVDREALNKIKKELQRRSLTLLKPKDENENKSDSTASYTNNTISAKDRTSEKNAWEELREKRRISRRTSILAPLNSGRRSTYESVKKAIQNSKVIQQLLDADNIEQQKLKGIHERKFPIVSENSTKPADQPSFPGSPSFSIKVPKREASKIKEKKVVKKKSSYKSDRSSNILSRDINIKQRSSLDSKKISKKSSNLKNTKNDAHKSGGSFSSTVSQQRRHTH